VEYFSGYAGICCCDVLHVRPRIICPLFGNNLISNNLGMLLSIIWLVLTGLREQLDLFFSGPAILMAILAIAAGVLIGLER